MKDKRPFSLFFSFVLLLMVQLATAQDGQSQLQEAEQYFKAGEYQKAINIYETLINEGKEAFGLYYNLGNAYFKKGNIPSALLYYERAKRLNPNDEDLQHNMAMAERQTVDEFEAVPELLVEKWGSGLVNWVHADVWGYLSIFFFVLMLVMAALFFMSAERSRKKLGFVTALICLMLAGTTFFLGQQQKYNSLNLVEAIVFEPSVTVRSMPAESGTSLFVVHEGSKVRILEQSDGWARVRLIDGNVGWLPQDAVRKI